MKLFQSRLPGGFWSKVKREVVAIKTPKEGKKKKFVEVYNTEIIFPRLPYLNSTDKIKINDLFSYELAPIPTYLFKDNGEERYSTSKVDLKNALKVEVSMRNIIPKATLIDVCEIMHSILHWPKRGKVSNLLVALRSYIMKFCPSQMFISYLTDTKIIVLNQI